MRQSTLPYRYLIERTLEADVIVGLGGTRVMYAGDSGLYGFTLVSNTNVDMPYVYLDYGVPQMGVFTDESGVPKRYLTLDATNLRGQPATANVPWASLVPTISTGGDLHADGYSIDLVNRSYAGLNFVAQTYPDGLPSWAGEEDPHETAFIFHVYASATPLTRDEFITQQRSEAEQLRRSILADPTASAALVALAANSQTWGTCTSRPSRRPDCFAPKTCRPQFNPAQPWSA